MNKGDVIQGRISRTKNDGYGLLLHDGVTLEIPGVVEGDLVRAQVEHLSRHRPRGWAKAVEVLSRSKDYVDPACPHAWPISGRCGGCPLMHLAPAPYQKLKSQWALEAVRPVLGDAPYEWHGAPSDIGYRNRCNFVPARGEGGEILLGSYAPRSHDVAPMNGCQVIHPAIDRLAQELSSLLTGARVPLYPEPGGLRYVTVRALSSSRLLVDLIIESAKPPWLEGLAQRVGASEDVSGVSYSVNPREGNVLRVDQSFALCGELTGIEWVGPVELELAASSFAQLNSAVAEQMYARVRPLVADGEQIWDLYCGAGSMGLALASEASDVVIHGAESVPFAIDLATKNAARNRVEGHYHVMDLAAPRLDDWPQPSLILVNPPRRGLDPALVSSLNLSRASRLIYMSCNPVTFARDAALLAESGWRLAQVDAYDMLPNSGHVELITVLLRG